MDVRIFEKHITLSNDFSDFIDHKVALNPKDFGNYVQSIRNAFLTIGKAREKIFNSEKNTLTNNRRSLYAKKNITKGQKVDNSNSLALRPHKKSSININKLNIIAKKNYKVNVEI